jgi:hypothetical protein
MRGLLALLLLIPFFAFSDSKTDSLFDQLKTEIGKKNIYDHQKEQGILKLKDVLKKVSKNNLQSQYTYSLKLYDEYKSYQYDSAYVYANKMLLISLAMRDRAKEDYSKIKIAFILISSGMFKETFDNLNDVNSASLSGEVKIEYYSLMTRAYYDLAEYDNDNKFSNSYNGLANDYIDSAIQLSKAGSYDQMYLAGYKRLKNKQFSEAEGYFNILLTKYKLTTHQNAIVTSTLSAIYRNSKRAERIDLLIEASISDIRSSTKETLALFWLAESLYKNGDNKDTYFYLQQANTDAEFYGARQRKIQIGGLLPIVATERMNYIEREKSRFLIYMGSITLLAAAVIWISIILSRQLKQLKIKEKIIDDKNLQLEHNNERLTENAKIQEEYIGYFFNVISGYIQQLEKLKRSIDMKLNVKKYEEIHLIIDKINIKKERETLFYTFDHVFLKIFPNFITEFNSLFKPEDQIWPKEHEVLTTDLRIFALIRMGVFDTETIAKILEYSEKTIYVYKMRIKAKSLIQGEAFEQRIMAIKAVDTESQA